MKSPRCEGISLFLAVLFLKIHEDSIHEMEAPAAFVSRCCSLWNIDQESPDVAVFGTALPYDTVSKWILEANYLLSIPSVHPGWTPNIQNITEWSGGKSIWFLVLCPTPMLCRLFKNTIWIRKPLMNQESP